MSNTATASNGYLIRLEVLKMAKEMAEQDWHAKREIETQAYFNEVEQAKSKEASLPSKPQFDPFPTPETIKAKASELYSFITTK